MLIDKMLGSYLVIARIGEGGMGEVYRARDTRLGRDVAIKVLPAAFTTDPDRLARFEREARVLASLNHPNIASIYGVEDAGGVPALIMEMVEGETLADLVSRGPVPQSRALSLAVQVAEALEAAHDKGIVHRDLKPANIKITPNGAVKVLDFGLAKATAREGAGGQGAGVGVSQSPTIAAGTRDGVILGTAPYMSPEQARGHDVDKRTDIWAFGCVLFEMLTGRRPFAGQTMSDTVAAILEREPDWSALPPTTPAGVIRLLRRCLDKDSNRRLHDIADARVEIEDVLSGAAARSSESPADAVDRRRHRSSQWIGRAAVAVAVVAVGALAWTLRVTSQSAPAPPRLSRLTMASSGATSLAVTGLRSVAITPDGQSVVYVGNNGTQLFVRRLDQLEPTAIATLATRLNWVFVSPDGHWVGFAEGNTLRKVALAGGPVTTIAQIDGGLRGATWASADTIIAASSDPASGLLRVPAAGGALSVVTRPDAARGDLDHLWPETLPGGQAILFTITAITGGLDAAQVAVLDLATGTSTVLVRGGSHAHYVPSGRGSPNRGERNGGHLVYVAGGTLRAVSFDLDQRQTRGDPVMVVPRLMTTPQGAGDFAVGDDGTLAYVDASSDVVQEARTLVWVDRQGREESLAAPPRHYFHPRLSPDGTRVAVAINEQETDIWMWDLTRQTLGQRTSDPANDFFPLWTPDGRRLFFFSRRAGASSLFWEPADGTGVAEALSDGLPSAVTPDGTQVLFSPAGRDLMALTLDSTRRVQPLIQTPFNERNGIVSPDGRWLAYESDSSGRFEIYVRPFPNVSAGQWLISAAGGTRPLWAPGGREVFYVAPEGTLMAVAVDSVGGTWSAGNPAKVVDGPYVTEGTNTGRTYDVSPDGRRFLMVKQAPGPIAVPVITVVQNWFEELKRLAVTPGSSR